MKRRWNKYDYIGSLLTVLVVALIISGVVGANTYVCGAKARVMKMNYQWGPIIGCMVEFEHGKWGPVGSIRSMQ